MISFVQIESSFKIFSVLYKGYKRKKENYFKVCFHHFEPRWSYYLKFINGKKIMTLK
jgi:hypothetical protein